jgi:hypothetical protein
LSGDFEAGADEGAVEGVNVGTSDGVVEGTSDGTAEGMADGKADGCEEDFSIGGGGTFPLSITIIPSLAFGLATFLSSGVLRRTPIIPGASLSLVPSV